MGKRTEEMKMALAEARGLGGADAFDAARSLVEEVADLDGEEAADCLEAARLARDYAKPQMELDIEEGTLGRDERRWWKRLLALG